METKKHFSNKCSTLLLFLTFFLLGGFVLHAAPLKEAQVTRILNDVGVVAPAKTTRPAVLNEKISGANEVRTGEKSRTELLFTDQTLARLGANSIFSFTNGTRDMKLDNGVILLQVPKGAGGATVKSAAVTAAITGTTIMMEAAPRQAVKVIVLEGTLRLFLNNRMGESTLIKPGNMIIMSPDAKKLPEPVPVNLDRLYKTSGLINKMGEKSEPAASTTSPTGTAAPPVAGTNPPAKEDNFNHEQVRPSIQQQTLAISRGAFDVTPLFIAGTGTELRLDPGAINNLVTLKNQADRTVSSGDLVTPPPPNGTTPVIRHPGTARLDSSAVLNGLTPPILTTSSGTYQGSVYRGVVGDPAFLTWAMGSQGSFSNRGIPTDIDSYTPALLFAFDSIEISGGMTFNMLDSKSVGFLAMSGDITSGSSNGTVNIIGAGGIPIKGFFLGTNGNMTLDSTLTFNTYTTDMWLHARGALSDMNINSTFTMGGGTLLAETTRNLDFRGNITGASSVEFNALGTTTVAGNNGIQAGDVQITGNRVNIGSASSPTIQGGSTSSSSGRVRIEGKASASSAVYVGDSSIIKALTNMSTQALVEIVSTNGGNIIVGPATVSANYNAGSVYSNGKVEIKNQGSGNVSISSASIMAETIRIGALGGNLTVGNSTLNAGSGGNIKLHAYNTLTFGAGVQMRASNIVLSAGSIVFSGGTVDLMSTNPNITVYRLGGTAPSGINFVNGSPTITDNPVGSLPSF